MHILMINKFLYKKGGSETYMFTLAKALEEAGHKVSFFGMADARNDVGEHPCVEVSNKDFHNDSKVQMAANALRTIRSKEAYTALREMLKKDRPDIAHIHNFNYQLTPAVLEALRDEDIPVVMTMHDAQLVCPNHMMYDLNRDERCYECVQGNDMSCIKRKCIHDSLPKSVIAWMEKKYWRMKHIYETIDLFICPSTFLQHKVIKNRDISVFNTIRLPNFTNAKHEPSYKGERQGVIYFGRLSKEKGIEDILEAARALPDVPFIIAGTGPLEEEVKKAAKECSNIDYKGFLSHDVLHDLVRHSMYSLYPSRWDENCPMSVIESICMGTPVIATPNGGLPELVKDGENGLLVRSKESLADTIERAMRIGKTMYESMLEGCEASEFMSPDEYEKKIEEIYQKIIQHR